MNPLLTPEEATRRISQIVEKHYGNEPMGPIYLSELINHNSSPILISQTIDESLQIKPLDK